MFTSAEVAIRVSSDSGLPRNGSTRILISERDQESHVLTKPFIAASIVQRLLDEMPGELTTSERYAAQVLLVAAQDVLRITRQVHQPVSEGA